MIDDCDRCTHSVAYHLSFVGCTKCDCDEYVVRFARGIVRRLVSIFL